MAKVSGGAALQRLQVPQDNMNQGLQYWGGIKARENAADKLADEREQVRKAEEVKAWEDKYGLDEEDFNTKVTGFTTYDDIQRDFADHASDVYVDLHDEAAEALRRGDQKALRQIEGKMMKVKNSFKNVVEADKILANQFKSYQEDVEAGNVSEASKNVEKFYQAALRDKKVIRRFDKESGKVMLIGETEDGEKMEIPEDDVFSGKFRYYKKTDLNETVTGIVETLGNFDKTTASSNYQTSSRRWDVGKNHTDTASKRIDSILSSDEKMADLYWKATSAKGEGKRQMTGFTEDQKKEVKEWLLGQVKTAYSEKLESTYTGKGDTLDAKKSSGGSGKETDTKQGLYIMKNTDGSPVKADLFPDDKNEKESIAYGFNEPLNLEIGEKSKRVDKVFMTPQGQIVWEGEQQEPKQYGEDTPPSERDAKAKEWRKVRGGGLNDTELGRIAIASGFADAAQMKKEMKRLMKEGNPSSNGTTTTTRKTSSTSNTSSTTNWSEEDPL